jgi:hypothetical protein
MRLTFIALLVLIISPVLMAQETPDPKKAAVKSGASKNNVEVVKAVRAVLSAKKQKDRDTLLEGVLARTDLDWPSVKEALMAGPYYQKPMVTEVGVRHSGKHMGIRLRGADGKERGFSVYVPRGYTAKNDAKIPVLLYLHHSPNASVNSGAEKADLALVKFRQFCEDYNVIFVAPYTGKGAEWWTDGGIKLIEWTLEQVKARYNIDEDKVGLVGTLDAADATWYVAQRMPGTWNTLISLSGDPFEMTAIVRPIYLGTLDRMDILLGVPGKLRTRFGELSVHKHLDGLKAHFDKAMRVTVSVHMGSHSDTHYLDGVRGQIMGFVTDDARKRKALANEVDIETDGDEALRSLWLKVQGYDADIKPPKGSSFPSTRLVWNPPAQKEPAKKFGIGLQKRDWPVGQVVNAASLGAVRAQITTGDVLVRVGDTVITKDTKVGKLTEGKNWGDEVEMVLAREVNDEERKGAERQQKQYLQIRSKMIEYKAAGKKLPADLSELIDDEGAEDEEEDEDDDGESEIEIGDGEEEEEEDDSGKDGTGARKRTWFLFKRYVKIIRPETVLIRQDLGITWDRAYVKGGVRIAGVTPGSLADRSGFKAGDVIAQVLGTEIVGMKNLREAFEGWKFEKQPEGERSVTFDIRRLTAGQTWIEESVRVKWEAPNPYRVDAKWNKSENRLDILVRFASKFTVYLTDELVKPNTDYHVFVNGVPYHDIIDPANRPEYPPMHPGGHGGSGKRRRMQMARAKIKGGWQPDFKFAIEDSLETRDRSLVMGAKLEFDLTKSKAAFVKARSHGAKPDNQRGERLKAALDSFGGG